MTYLLEHGISTATVLVNDETLSRLCDIYGPRPEPPSGSSEIRHRCQSFYLSAAILAETKLLSDGVLDNSVPEFDVLIDASDDRADIAVVDYEGDIRPFCYFRVYVKSWSFGFKTLKELAGQVLDVRDAMVEKFLELTGHASQKGIQ